QGLALCERGVVEHALAKFPGLLQHAGTNLGIAAVPVNGEPLRPDVALLRRRFASSWRPQAAAASSRLGTAWGSASAAGGASALPRRATPALRESRPGRSALRARPRAAARTGP